MKQLRSERWSAEVEYFPNVILENGEDRNLTRDGQAAKTCRFSIHICCYRMDRPTDGAEERCRLCLLLLLCKADSKGEG